MSPTVLFFFFQAEDGIRYWSVTGVQTCALPIWRSLRVPRASRAHTPPPKSAPPSTAYPLRARNTIPATRSASLIASAFRSEEHTSELQSLTNLVCRLLLEKKKNNRND